MTAHADGRALGTTTRVVATDPDQLSLVRALLNRAARDLDAAASRFRPDSELSRLNAAGGQPTRVGPLLRDGLQHALRMAAATGGLVDPTVGGALLAAGYDRTFRDLPAPSGRLTSPTALIDWHIDWRDVLVDPDEGGAWVTLPPACRLDLGCTGKAWLADTVAARAYAATGSGVLVDLGGDIAVAGPPPQGGWLVALPSASAPVSIGAGGLATSGRDVRQWMAADGPAHHLIDPRTGLPAVTGWQTVTVHAASTLEANAASTAAMVLGPDAPEWLAGLGLAARLVPRSGAPALVGPWPQPDPALTSNTPHPDARGEAEPLPGGDPRVLHDHRRTGRREVA